MTDHPPLLLHTTIGTAAGGLFYLLLEKYNPGFLSISSGVLLMSIFIFLLLALSIAGKYERENKRKGCNAADIAPVIEKQMNRITFSFIGLCSCGDFYVFFLDNWRH